MAVGLIFSEEDFERSVEYPTEAELKAYGDGLSYGANLYGAGSCFLLTRADVDDDQYGEKVLARAAKEFETFDRLKAFAESKTPTS